jgi:hypothetical protein
MVATYGPLLVVRDTEEGQEAVQKLLAQLGAALTGMRQQADPFGGGDPFGSRPSRSPSPRPPEAKPVADPFAP